MKYHWRSGMIVGMLILGLLSSVSGNAYAAETGEAEAAVSDSMETLNEMTETPDAALSEAPETTVIRPTGWLRDGKDWYYYSEEGIRQTGWIEIGTDWYFMDFRGVMQTGWQELGGRWFYFRKNGTMYTGWKKENGYWFYMKPSGAMTIGWREIGGKWYFFGKTGRMLTGWRSVGGKWYFFEASGCMALDTWIGDYYLDPSGAWNPEAKKPPAGYAKLDVKCVYQNPELPNGCEVTSLAIVLRHLGYPVSKETLADNYLPKGRIGYTSPYEAYIGNPRIKNASWYCYSPVIVRCADNYLATQGGKHFADDLTGKEFEELLSELDKGYPVIFWATINMDGPRYSSDWVVDGTHYECYLNLHCLVLTGYDQEKNLAYVSDPLRGNVTYSLEETRRRYEQLHYQAVVIRER